MRLNILTDNPLFLETKQGSSYGIDKWFSVNEMVRKCLFDVLLFRSVPKLTGASWFLPCLFFSYSLYMVVDYVIKRCCNRCGQGVLDLSMVLLFFFSTGLTLIGHNDNSGYRLNIIMISVALIHMGRRIKEHRSNEDLLFTVFLGALATWTLVNIHNGAFSYIRGNIVGVVFLLLASVSGWLLISGISHIIDCYEGFLSSLFQTIGKYSLQIMLLHQLSFKIITLIQIRIYHEQSYLLASYPTLYTDRLWWIAYILAGVIVPILVTLIIKRILGVLG